VAGRRASHFLLWSAVLAGGLLVLDPASASAQGTGDPTTSDSSVGYIDSAIPISQLRLRFDAAYDFERPSRAEFFYAQTKPGGPGLPLPEKKIDYQDISTYLELAANPWLSGFVEVPVRFLNPEVNTNTAGLADMNAGFKLAFLQTCATTATFQLRTYVPTGAASRGLGTRHVSLEPALLVDRRLGEHWLVEGELRYWAPAGGTDFAGDVIRYGVGVSRAFGTESLRISPVVELVAWTVLSGKEPFVAPDAIGSTSAAGDTIVNGKLGVRMALGSWGDVYAGYGRALTGTTWYKDIFRVELRWRF
jgi:hypothetical protein